MNDPLSLIYEARVVKKSDPFQAIYDRIKIVNGQKIIECSVNLSNQELTKLPDLHDVHVNGCFYCDNNRLTSLEGSPMSVSGEFYCNINQLTSLKGAPKSIGQYFHCGDNPLPEGTPEVMNAQQYQECRKELKKKEDLQKEFGNDIGQTIYDL